MEEKVLEGINGASPLLWIGFRVLDTKIGDLGMIEDVIQTGSQWLAQIRVQGKEALIPLVEQTMVKTDLKKKILYTRLPDGLLEVYLGGN